MAKQVVSATSTEQTIYFEQPCEAFAVLALTNTVLVTPIASDRTVSEQAVCLPNLGIGFKGLDFIGFKYVRETADGNLNYYITEV